MTTGFDVLGVGVGPFNLSLAALLNPISGVRAGFFERSPSFDWHPGMMLAGSRMQTSFLKDLVTPADPTSRFGFLSYLVSRGQFYRFMNAEFPRVLRTEFASYLRWVVDQLENLHFGHEVKEVSVRNGGFTLLLDNAERVQSQHLVVAAGLRPHVPEGVAPLLGTDCFHSHGYMRGALSVEQRRVAIVGGGQSSAEIFLDLLAGNKGRALSVDWITRRSNLSPLDETAFTNEYFTPDYVRSFHRLPDERRRALVAQQKLAGDGVSPATLSEVAQRLYELECLDGEGPACRVLPERELRGLRRERAGFKLSLHNSFSETAETLEADVVILATGYRYHLPECLAPMADRLARDAEGYPRLREDYSAVWDGPQTQRLYMQNAGRSSHGIADAQLSLAAWRAAVICNSITGREVYRTEARSAPLQWHPQRRPASAEKGATQPPSAQPWQSL